MNNNGKALARNSDPITSKISALAVQGERANELEQIVIDALWKYPNGLGKHPKGLTTWEICDATGLEWNSASPRMKPLMDKKLVVVLGAVPERMGKPCQVWGLKALNPDVDNANVVRVPRKKLEAENARLRKKCEELYDLAQEAIEIIARFEVNFGRVAKRESADPTD